MPESPPPSPTDTSRRGPAPLAVTRAALVAVGTFAGVLLVRALDRGLRGTDVELGAGHVVFGILVGLAVMPGPILAFFVGPGHSERARGLAFGGCVVTMFAALLGGAMLWHRLFGTEPGPATPAEWLALAWCALALPVAGIDAVRVRFGGGPTTDAGDPA